MGAWMLASLQLGFVTLAIAACAVMARQARTKLTRRTWLAIAAVPLLIVDGALCGLACWVRFGRGAETVPWIPAVLLLALHIVSLAWLFTRVGPKASTNAWRALPLACGAFAVLAVESAVLSNLELRGRLVASSLEIEAGRLAYASGPTRVDDASNAALVYAKHFETIHRDDELDVEPWADQVLGKAELDTADPRLRAVLARWAPILADTRRATSLPHCWFTPEEGEVRSPSPPVIALIRLARATALTARVRMVDGDLSGAIGDLEALHALARHLAETPTLITVYGAAVMREYAVALTVELLASKSIDAKLLQRLEPAWNAALLPELGDAMAGEKAFTLGHLGEAFAYKHARRYTYFANDLQQTLYVALMFEEEVRGHRGLMTETLALARSPLPDVARFFRENEADFARRTRAAGILPSLMHPESLARSVLRLHAMDARFELSHLAIAAKRFELEHGRFPKTASELANVPAHVAIEGDGTFVLLRDTRSDFDAGPELRVPSMPRKGP